MEGRLEELRRWHAEAVEELRNAQTEVAAAQQRLEACRERLRLLDRLLAVETGTTTTSDAPDASESKSHEGVPTDELLDACERILRKVGAPMHISDLHAALLKEGTPIPGRGTEANLLVRLHRSNGRFVRTGRGTYAPVSMGAEEVRPTQRRRVSVRSEK